MSLSPSATILELRVHLFDLPAAETPFSLSHTEVDESVLRTYSQGDLVGWNDLDEDLKRPRLFGDMQLNDSTVFGFLAPSVTSNGFDQTVVLNPSHLEFLNLVWTSYDFIFDSRLW